MYNGIPKPIFIDIYRVTSLVAEKLLLNVYLKFRWQVRCSYPGGRFNSIKKSDEKRMEKGPESKFATSICMNSEKDPGLYRFGPIFTKEISILIP